MTTSKVTQIGLYAGTPQNAGQVKNNQSDEFSKIFASQSTQTENKTETKAETKTNETTEKVENVSETKEDSSVKETTKVEKTEEGQEVTEIENTEENVQNVDEEELDTEEVMEAITEIMATIQNVLGVTPEELQSALEELGLSVEDLLNTEIIPKIVVALTEGADELSVMTNAELFADIQEITAKVEGIVNELSAKLGISPEDVKGMLQNMTQNMEQPEPVVEEVVSVVKTDDIAEVPVTEENRLQVSVERPEASRNTEDGKQGADTNANQQMTFAQNVAEQIEQAVAAKTETTYSSYSTTQNIMNQIQDVIKVIQTQDLTEMELQLHPATLGNVRVQLAVTEGVLTATFTTENEAVRAALESQMLILKQNFEEQGIKVEAVEVTVASHAFERNLDSSENGAGEEQAPEKKKSGRRISLTELMDEIEEEELSDEDRILAEMMRQNGNTVDYTV